MKSITIFRFLYGEQAMAKALVAIRLYKCMSKEAAYDCKLFENVDYRILEKRLTNIPF